MTTRPSIQPFADLDAATEAALRASIVRFGVIIPVVKDQHGRILDGNQRARIAADLGVIPDEIIVKVEDEDEAREYARTLNVDRRHLDPDQRRAVVGALREQGHSLRAIAGAVGASKSQIAKDINQLSTGGQLMVPTKVVGRDGRRRPSRRTLMAAQEAARKAKLQAKWDREQAAHKAKREATRSAFLAAVLDRCRLHPDPDVLVEVITLLVDGWFDGNGERRATEVMAGWAEAPAG
jgi:ParB-like chromosome segregation protein Spo0J